MKSLSDIPVPAPFLGFRRFALDDALLLFDRDSGWNALIDGEETQGLRMTAPRSVQFAITNHCNLACHFCSRDVAASSRWSSESAFTFLAEMAQAGTLEVAFGGGEPFVFKGFEELVGSLYDETPLAISVTTNGTQLSREKLRKLHGKYGQLRLSLYDDNNWRQTATMLSDERVRWGANWLVTPERCDRVQDTVLELATLGCSDVLLLSYNGRDRALHLDPESVKKLSGSVRILARALQGRVQLKLDVCWGERLQPVPQVLASSDCGAGRDFVVVTSEQQIAACSFHHLRFPMRSAADALSVWNEQRAALSSPSRDPGCARIPSFGLSHRSLPLI